MMVQGLLLNLILIFFNLIPIPPLDGSHVMKYLLPLPLAIRYQRISRYGILILVAMMWFLPNSLSTLMTPATKTFSWTLDKIEGSTLPSTRQWLIR
jgi:Zn-dependent protease